MTDQFRIYQDSDAPPGWGVIGIVYYNEWARDWLISSGGDYYVYRNGTWNDCDLVGMVDHVINVPGVMVVAGRTVPNEIYRATMAQMMADQEYARKHGELPND